mmetsp:Transcript_22369/g.55427  ORF Transcript_22369/g.55427 Transcript_22369/m.55427 type:complete len:380 (+) Transcript_22369:1778-2917(+)
MVFVLVGRRRPNDGRIRRRWIQTHRKRERIVGMEFHFGNSKPNRKTPLFANVPLVSLSPHINPAGPRFPLAQHAVALHDERSTNQLSLLRGIVISVDLSVTFLVSQNVPGGGSLFGSWMIGPRGGIGGGGIVKVDRVVAFVDRVIRIRFATSRARSHAVRIGFASWSHNGVGKRSCPFTPLSRSPRRYGCCRRHRSQCRNGRSRCSHRRRCTDISWKRGLVAAGKEWWKSRGFPSAATFTTTATFLATLFLFQLLGLLCHFGIRLVEIPEHCRPLVVFGIKFFLQEIKGGVHRIELLVLVHNALVLHGKSCFELCKPQTVLPVGVFQFLDGQSQLVRLNLHVQLGLVILLFRRFESLRLSNLVRMQLGVCLAEFLVLAF